MVVNMPAYQLRVFYLHDVIVNSADIAIFGGLRGIGDDYMDFGAVCRAE